MTKRISGGEKTVVFVRRHPDQVGLGGIAGEEPAARIPGAGGLLGLRAAVSLDGYMANPIGRYFAGDSVAVFCASAAVTGISFWGHPNDREMDLIASALRAVPSTWIGSHVSIVDARKLDFLDLRAFDKLWVALGSRCAGSRPSVARRAVITRPGPTGTVVGTLFGTLSPACSARSFDDAVEALTWLGVDHHILLRDLERIARTASVDIPIIRDLERLLDR